MIVHSPEDAIVVYGQPNVGLVIVHVTEKKKMEVKDILKAMTIEKKSRNKKKKMILRKNIKSSLKEKLQHTLQIYGTKD